MYDKLFELLAVARENDLAVEVSLHGVPLVLAAQMMQDGLLDTIEKGALGNPPTGRYEAPREEGKGRVSAVVFTDGPRRKADIKAA